MIMNMPDKAPEPAAGEKKENNGFDILLVEDNPSYVDLTLRALQEIANHHLKIEIASDGQQALDMLLDEHAPRRPRLVILDIKLPKFSGIEVLRQVRAGESTRLLPVVVLSSSRVVEDVAECYALGANSYVVRPMNFPSYLKIISDIINYWLVINEPPPAPEKT